MSATMMRTTAIRSIPRSLTSAQAVTPRANLVSKALRASLRTSARPARASRVLAVAAFQPGPKALVRYAHNAHLWDTAKQEKSYHSQLLQPVPQAVSSDSTVRQVTGEVTKEADDDVDMMAGIRSDFVRLHNRTQGLMQQVLILEQTEHYQRDFQLGFCATGSHVCWPGWCDSIPRNISYHRLPFLRYSICRNPRSGLFHVR